MKLRAKTSTAINTPKGLVFIRGPEISDTNEIRLEGEVVDVDDDFVVQPDVFEILEPPAGKKKPKLAKTRAQLIAESEAARTGQPLVAAGAADPGEQDPDAGDKNGASKGASKGAGGKGNGGAD